MSHTVTQKSSMKDRKILDRVCAEKGYLVKHDTVVSMFGASERGTSIQLPGWRYPICVAADGTVRYDNYNGAWGKQEVLSDLMTAYNEVVIMDEVNAQGFRLEERQESEQFIDLIVEA